MQLDKYNCLFVSSANAFLVCWGDMETNSGPKFSSISFRHGNLNGVTAHNFFRVSLL